MEEYLYACVRHLICSIVILAVTIRILENRNCACVYEFSLRSRSILDDAGIYL